MEFLGWSFVFSGISRDKKENLKIPLGFSRRYALNALFGFFLEKAIYWKLRVSIKVWQRAHRKNIKKCQEFIKILTLIYLKLFYKLLKDWGSPVFDNIFTANILGIWENRGLYFPCGVLPNELLSQYRCFPKTDDNDRTHKLKIKWCKYPILTYELTNASNASNTLDKCFFLEKFLIAGIQITCFGILKTLC